MFISILILLLSLAVFALAWNTKTQGEINTETQKTLQIQRESIKNIQKYFDQEITDKVGDSKREFTKKLAEIEEKFAFENQEILTKVEKIDKFQKTQHKRLSELEGEKIFNS